MDGAKNGYQATPNAALEQQVDTCPTCGSECNERDELEKAEREIERLRAAPVQQAAPVSEVASSGCRYLMFPDRICNKCGRIHGYSHPPAAEVQRLRDAAQVVLAMVEAIGRRAFTTDGWAAVLELRRALEGGE